MSLSELLSVHQLPIALSQWEKSFFTPLIARIRNESRPSVLAISGCQGAGKSSIAQAIKLLLQPQGLNVVCLSLDDFYLSSDERAELASRIHPLFAVRGVPGTHNVAEAIQIIQKLKEGHLPLALPAFDKSIDNPMPKTHWKVEQRKADLVIFEGWCLGARPQSKASMAHPVNTLEAERDKDAIWRNSVNQALTGAYQRLFAMADRTIYLKPPGFECVASWRWQQELSLKQRCGEHAGMSQSEINEFVLYYQRITEHQMQTCEQQMDLVVELGEDRAIRACHWHWN